MMRNDENALGREARGKVQCGTVAYDRRSQRQVSRIAQWMPTANKLSVQASRRSLLLLFN